MYKNFSDSILLPKLIQIKDNLILAKFDLMKIIPAKYIINTALDKNQINPDLPIVETSSGTFAMSLGIICAELNLPFFIISDPAIDSELERLLIQLGGKVQILTDALKNNNPQELRLNTLKEYLCHNPEAFWTNQYDNLQNQAAYKNFADFLMAELGQQITLVGAVGSGGSTCGTIKTIRERNINAKLIGVDTLGSVLFGLPNHHRLLRGLGNSLLPKNVDHTCFDEVHWVTANDAFVHARNLYTERALFCGPTTGATYQVANWIAANNPDELVVCIAADTGYRYQQTLYNDDWLAKNALMAKVSNEPLLLNHPQEANSHWCYLNWKRRKLNEVIQNLEK